ncbi:MAG: hypothetical protein ABIE55_01005 [Candidatus Aenigmatarchaeota archaeon]
MAPEAILLINLVKTDKDSKNESMEALKGIEEVETASLTYGPRDMIIAKVQYSVLVDGNPNSNSLVNIVEKVSKLENIGVDEVHRVEAKYQSQ